MKSRIQKIEIRNFKAFREFTLNLEGRHLLIYGDNGAGKSSLYWALYTFLQSARKPINTVAKYFDPAGQENLLNIHEQAEPAPGPGEIALTLRDAATKIDTVYRISQASHDTHQQPLIVKGDLASDFITYRFFFGFSDFKNSDSFNLWPLFLREILPFCVTLGGGAGELEDLWKELEAAPPNPNHYTGTAGAKAFREFNSKLKHYTHLLRQVVDDISSTAQTFYNTHFADGDSVTITLKLAVTNDAFYSQQYKVKVPPEIRFGIQANGTEVKKPQSFLNEAKLTQLALSVRFAASLVNLHESDLKLLVLDDLLVSLDMSNRMKVVEILLTDQSLADYQKIILTHDRGLFDEFRRMIGTSHSEWSFRLLQGNPKDGIDPKEEKDALEKASDYLNGHDLEAAALQLRKAAEDTAQSYLKMATGKAPKPGEFHSLSQKLDKAKNILLSKLPLQLFKDVCSKVPEAHRDKLVRMNDDDIDAEAGLTPDEKTLLKQQREKLKVFMTKETWKSLEAINVIDAVIKMKDRVLNPAAHWSETPLYNAEVKKALTLVERLRATLLK